MNWDQAGEDFLRRYVLAFNTFDGQVIAGMYHAPCILLRGDASVTALASHAEVAAFFQPVAEALHGQGCRDWGWDGVSVLALGLRSALVSVDWQPLDAAGKVIRRWRQSYNLVGGDRPARILASTMHIG